MVEHLGPTCGRSVQVGGEGGAFRLEVEKRPASRAEAEAWRGVGVRAWCGSGVGLVG